MTTLADRVKETTTTTGTGAITLAGAEPGFQSFAVIGNGNSTWYSIIGNGEWEVGVGTYTAAGTLLSRDTVLSSSNGGALVNFSAGSKDVIVTQPASKAAHSDNAVMIAGAQTITGAKTFSSEVAIDNIGDGRGLVFAPELTAAAMADGLSHSIIGVGGDATLGFGSLVFRARGDIEQKIRFYNEDGTFEIFSLKSNEAVLNVPLVYTGGDLEVENSNPQITLKDTSIGSAGQFTIHQLNSEVRLQADPLNNYAGSQFRFMVDNVSVGIWNTTSFSVQDLANAYFDLTGTFYVRDSDNADATILQVSPTIFTFNGANVLYEGFNDPDFAGTITITDAVPMIDFVDTGGGTARFDGRDGRVVIEADKDNVASFSSMTFKVDGATKYTLGGSGDHVSFFFGGNFGLYDSDNGNNKMLQYGPTNGLQIYNTSGTEVMRLDSSGRLGLGTAPGATAFIHMASHSPILRFEHSTTGDYTDFYGVAGNMIIDVDQAQTALNSYFAVNIDGSETIKINTNFTYLGNPVGSKVAVPATATSTGRAGDYAVDANYLYMCYATNNWRRVAVATW